MASVSLSPYNSELSCLRASLSGSVLWTNLDQGGIDMRKLWKLTAICTFGMCFGFLTEKGARVEAYPVGYCLESRPSCTGNADPVCQEWCGPLAEQAFCYNFCCYCIM